MDGWPLLPSGKRGIVSTAATKKTRRSLIPLHLHAGRRRLRIQLGKIGRIRTELLGTPCPHCGSSKYQVVLHRDLPPGPAALVCRCLRCRTRRDLDKEGMRDTVLFRYGLHPAGSPAPRPATPI